MKQYIFAATLVGLVGCGGGPNPLETYDQDRLYVLIDAAVNRGKGAECARYFQGAAKPASGEPAAAFMRAALAQVCPASMVKIAAYLEHNGVAGVTPTHVKDVAFWERLKTKDKAAAAEREQKRQEVGGERRKCRRAASDRERGWLDGQPGLLLKDFPNAQAWRVAWDEAQQQERAAKKKYRAERKACGSGRWSPPSREALGISLPEGMRVDMVGRIN